MFVLRELNLTLRLNNPVGRDSSGRIIYRGSQTVGLRPREGGGFERGVTETTVDGITVTVPGSVTGRSLSEQKQIEAIQSENKRVEEEKKVLDAKQEAQVKSEEIINRFPQGSVKPFSTGSNLPEVLSQQQSTSSRFVVNQQQALSDASSMNKIPPGQFTQQPDRFYSDEERRRELRTLKALGVEQDLRGEVQPTSIPRGVELRDPVVRFLTGVQESAEVNKKNDLGTQVVQGVVNTFAGSGLLITRAVTQSPVTTLKEVGTGFLNFPVVLGEFIQQPPGFIAGSLLAETATGFGVGRAAQVASRNIPFSVSKIEVPTPGGGSRNIYSFGFDSGTVSKPLISLSRENVLVTRRVGDDFVTISNSDLSSVPFSVPPSTRLQFGSPSPRFTTSFSDIPGGRGIAVPESALAGNVFKSQFDLSFSEQTRISSAVTASRILQKDTGLPVRDVLFNVEELRNPSRASKIFEDLVVREEGIFYGSGVTQQLPKQFRNTVIGDIDTFFPQRTPEQLAPIVAETVTRLRLIGEDVRVSPSNPLTIEFTNTRSKLFEAKTGAGIPLPGTEVANAGFLGIRFPDLKSGQSPSTVSFGDARAITAGEQFTRKGAASLFFNPPIDTPNLPKAFSEGGVFGMVRYNDPRTLKDVAGFIQTGKGLVAIRESRGAGIFDFGRTSRASSALDDFYASFSSEQQILISSKLKEITGSPFVIPLQRETPSSLSPSIRASSITPALKSVTPVSPVPYGVRDLRIQSPSLSVDMKPLSPSVSVSSASPRVSSPVSSVASSSPRVSSSPSSSIYRSISPSSRPVSPSVVSIPSSPSLSVASAPISPGSPLSPSTVLSPGSPIVPGSPSRIIPPPSKSPLLPITDTPFVPKTLLPPRLASRDRSAPEFEVVVGSKNNKFFFNVGRGGAEVIEKGRRLVKDTAAASITVRRLRPGRGVDDVDVRSVLGRGFSKSRSKKDTFVEDVRDRISSAGEKSQIPGEARRINLINKDFFRATKLQDSGLSLRNIRKQLKGGF